MGLKDWLTKAITSSGQTRTTSSTTSPARAPLNRNFRPPPPHPGARTVAPGRPRTGSPLGGATAARWVPAGETVTLGRVTIGGGLIYTGVHLPAGNGHRDDACLINPTLPVDFAHVDTAGALMGYWPHYANIHPSSRAGYLEWLAGGRGPGAAVGYVFLFFYGLERRIFVDLASSTTGTAANERRIIAAEIERLAGLYDHSASFRRYSGQLLDSLAVLDVGDRLYDQAPPVPRNLWDFPAALTIGLAQHAADGRALDAAWAYAWALGRSNERQRTVPQRCRAELARLFAGRYDTRWPDGVTVPPTGPPLTLTYQGASPSIGQLTVRVTELHDISAEPGIGDTLAALVDECIDDLDAYSRWIGKPGRRRNNLPAIARMPADLIATLDSPPVDRLRTWAARMIDRAHSPMAVIDGHALAAVWSGAAKTAGKLTPTESALIAGALEAVGYGIEPDVRHGGNAIGAGNVVLYTLEPGVAPGPHGHPRSPGQTPGQAIDVRYVGAALLVDLAAMVANADGTVTTDEHAAVLVHLEEGIGLDAA